MKQVYRAPLVPSYLPRPIAPDCLRAGFPSPALDYEEATLDINEYLIDNPPATFFFRLKGVSMVEFGLLDDDILVVNRAIDPQDGHFVVAFVNGERLCKKLCMKEDGPWLVAGSPDFAPIKMNEDSIVWGVVTGRFAKVKA